MSEILKDNTKYDLKTIKIKPETYGKLIRAKATLEFEKSELHSFDGFIDHLVEFFMDNKKVVTNDPNLKKKADDFEDKYFRCV